MIYNDYTCSSWGGIIKRVFSISYRYYSCYGDEGWMVIRDMTNIGGACTYDNHPVPGYSVQWPAIFYSSYTTPIVWDDGLYDGEGRRISSFNYLISFKPLPHLPSLI